MKYVYAKEAGILPGEEITRKLNTLLSELAENDEEKTLVFEKGEYFLDSANAPEPLLYITNTMGDGEWKRDERPHLNRVGMYFKGIRSLTVEGNSSVFTVRGSLTNIAVCNCKDLCLKNFTLVTENPDMHSFRVARKREFAIDFELDGESRYICDKGKYIFVGKDYRTPFTEKRATAYWIGKISADNADSIRRTTHPLRGAIRVKEIGERLFRATYAVKPRCAAGDEFYVYDVRRKYQGIFVDGSKDVRIESVAQPFNYGLALVFQNTENIAVINSVFAPAEGGALKMASVADFMQVCCCRGKVTVRGNRFCGAGDDCLNVHGVHFRIKKHEGDTLLLSFMHPQTHGFCPFRTGDAVRFVSPATLLPLAEGTVKRAEPAGEYDIRLELYESPETELAGLVAENASACPDLDFAGNSLDRIITRGLLVTTAGKVLIEDNDFRHTSMSAILVSDDARSWYESGFVRNVVIRNNRFYANKGYYVCVKPENKKHKGYVHSGIRVEDNLFDSPSSEGLYFKSAKDCIVKDNKFKFTRKIKIVRSELLTDTEEAIR